MSSQNYNTTVSSHYEHLMEMLRLRPGADAIISAYSDGSAHVSLGASAGAVALRGSEAARIVNAANELGARWRDARDTSRRWTYVTASNLRVLLRDDEQHERRERANGNAPRWFKVLLLNTRAVNGRDFLPKHEYWCKRHADGWLLCNPANRAVVLLLNSEAKRALRSVREAGRRVYANGIAAKLNECAEMAMF